MKALDYFLLVCAIVLLCVAFYLATQDQFRTAAIVNICAYVCGVVSGTRIGGRIYKKNQENK